MRILHFNHHGANVGGVEGYIADVSSALAAAGHDSQLVSFAAEDPDKLMPGTIQVAASQTESILAGVGRVVADFQPDVAYVHSVYDPDVIQWIFGRLPSVAFVHGPYLVCPGYALYLRKSSRVCTRRRAPAA